MDTKFLLAVLGVLVFCAILGAPFAFGLFLRRIIYSHSGTQEYLNEQNDGIYSITNEYKGQTYKMEFDINNRVVHLQKNSQRKTYSFNEITGTEYNIAYMDNYGRIVKPKDSYFMIKTTDLVMPIWKMPVIPNGSLASKNSYDITVEFNDKWQQLISNILRR